MDVKDLKVELWPHVGKQGIRLGNETVEVDVVFDQCFVNVNGPRVGIYLGKRDEPNKVLTFTEPMPQALQDAIAAKVAEITGGVKSTNAPAPEEHEVIDSE